VLENLREPSRWKRRIQRKKCPTGLLHPDHGRQKIATALSKQTDEDVRANACIGKVIGDSETAACEVAIAEERLPARHRGSIRCAFDLSNEPLKKGAMTANARASTVSSGKDLMPLVQREKS
jgi:hypothetical protein